jgi:uncharacterized membrane protein YkoI
MRNRFWKTSAGVVVLAALGGVLGATVAVGAGSATKGTATTTTSTERHGHAGETPLTGDVLAKVKAAAVAKVGGTVDSATTENDSDNANAAYEAHVTKADGTHVEVILDQSYNVLAVETGHDHGHHGHGHGHGNGETELTGDVAAKAKAAALAKVGGTVERATTENDSDNASAAYEVHVAKADGTHVEVILDKSFAVLSVETREEGHHGGHH